MSDSLCRWESYIQKAEGLIKRWNVQLKAARKDKNKKVIDTATQEIASLKTAIALAKAEITAIKKKQTK